MENVKFVFGVLIEDEIGGTIHWFKEKKQAEEFYKVYQKGNENNKSDKM